MSRHAIPTFYLCDTHSTHSDMSAFAIAVFQTTATVAINDDNAPVANQPFVQVLNVVVETDTHILSLIRYVPDLLEFDTLVYTHIHTSILRYLLTYF